MFPVLLYFFWLALQAFTAFSLLIPAVLCSFYFILQYKKNTLPPDDELHEEKDYAIIVSANGPEENLRALLQALCRLTYTNYIIYVAGNDSVRTSIHTHDSNIIYLRTAKVYNSQAFLYRFVIENFRRPHTHVAILDTHHLVDENYLTNLNRVFHQGYQVAKCPEALQGKEKSMYSLQSVTNAYRGFFAGKMMSGLGSSTTLSDSGIAFSVTCFKKCLKKIKAHNSDFASALQTQLIQYGYPVAFASEAFVYSTSPAGKKELARHHALRVHLWLIGLLFYGKITAKGLLRRNTNQWLYGIMSVRLPLPTCLLAAAACLAVNIKIHPATAFFWSVSLLLIPVYAIIALKQSSGSSSGEHYELYSEELAESIAMFEQEDEFGVIAQTV